MMNFILSLDWTDQGIRNIKQVPSRVETAKGLAKKLGIEIRHMYLTSGEHDLVLLLDTPNGDQVAKFCLALGALGNVRTTTARAWNEEEFMKIVAELP